MCRPYDLNARTLELARALNVTYAEARRILGQRGAEARTRKAQNLRRSQQLEERKGLR